jgi:hypothetical protein
LLTKTHRAALRKFLFCAKVLTAASSTVTALHVLGVSLPSLLPCGPAITVVIQNPTPGSFNSPSLPIGSQFTRYAGQTEANIVWR